MVHHCAEAVPDRTSQVCYFSQRACKFATSRSRSLEGRGYLDSLLLGKSRWPLTPNPTIVYLWLKSYTPS